MPLIIITGTPCSGKTFRAQQVLQDLKCRIEESQTEPKRAVIHLPSHHASLDPPPTEEVSYLPPDQSVNPRDTIYLSARQEKIARAEEFSAIKRALSKNAIVIADAPNYIKGFRYQLFCEAKAVGTTSIVLHTAAREDESTAWNNARLEAWNWPTEPDEDGIPNGDTTNVSGPKIGSNVLGDLDPESHTAIYGDKVINEGIRSRSSSTGAAISDDDGDVPTDAQRRADDTMTLKSLYITDRHDASAPAHLPSSQHTETPVSTQTESHELPPSTPPSPFFSLPYSPSTLKSLHMRYEPPSPFTRWDTPLFTVPSADPHPPYSQIWSALFPTPTRPSSKKTLARQQQQQQNHAPSVPTTSIPPTDAAIRPNAATILPTSHAPNALQTLESTTGDIVKLLLSASRSNPDITAGSGGTLTFTLPIPETTEDLELSIDVPEGLVLSQPVLQRARRKYTQIQRGGIAHGQGYVAGLNGRRGVAEGFVRFLEGEWEGVV